MALPENVRAMMAQAAGGVKKARQGGYYYLIKGAELPWLCIGKSQAAAYKQYKAASKLVKAGETEGAFKSSDKVLEGPVLFRKNRVVLVLGPESAVQNSGGVKGWLPRAAGALAREGDKELKVIAAVLKKAACIGHEESEEMKKLEQEQEQDVSYQDDADFEPFDEAEEEDAQRVAASVAEQLQALAPAQVGKRVADVEAQLLGTARLIYEVATGLIEEELGEDWQGAELSALRQRAPQSQGMMAWMHQQLGDLAIDCEAALGMVADLEDGEVGGLADFRAAVQATLRAAQQRRGQVIRALPKCAVCLDEVMDDEPGRIHPHATKDSCGLWIHGKCFRDLAPQQQILYIMIQPTAKGKPAKCAALGCDEVDPRIYEPLIGDKANRLYAITQADPNVDVTGKYTGPIPIGAFRCPVCGGGFGWAGGCDVITCPVDGDFNIMTGRQVADIGRGGRHTTQLQESLSDIRAALREKDFDRFLARLRRAPRANQIFQLDKIPQLEQAAQNKNVDLIHDLCGAGCPSAVLDECHERIRAHYLKRAGSNCYLTTACTRARGLDDDCEELAVLRAFRDGWLSAQPGGPALIARYYATAPRIVEAISDLPDAGARFEAIYLVVRGCVEDIRAGRPQAALAAYRRLVEALTRSHLLAPTC